MSDEELKGLREEYGEFVEQIKLKVGDLNGYLRRLIQEGKSDEQLRNLTISLIEEVRSSEFPRKIMGFLEKRKVKASFVLDSSDYKDREWKAEDLQWNIHLFTSIVEEAKCIIYGWLSETEEHVQDIRLLRVNRWIRGIEVEIGQWPTIRETLERVEELFCKRSKKGV